MRQHIGYERRAIKKLDFCEKRRAQHHPIKGRFAQLLEQNPNLLNLPGVRNQYFVARFSKYDFWIPDKISHRYGCPDFDLTPFEL